MSRVVIFDESDGAVLQYLKSANTPDFEGRSDALINPPALLSIPLIDSLSGKQFGNVHPY